MIKLIGTLLWVVINFSNAFAVEEVETLIREELIKKSAIQYPNSEIEIEISSISAISNDQIINIDLYNINKINKTFVGLLKYQHLNKILSNRINGKYCEFLLVPVLNKVIKKGKIITKDDILLTRINSAAFKKNQITNQEDIIGKTSRSIITPHKAISFAEIIDPILVEKGKIISLIYDNNQVSIKMSVQAMESGSIGDVIKVKNLKSNVILNASVSGESTVTIKNNDD